jgi:hypothetical protein
MAESPPTTDVLRHLDDVPGSEYAKSLRYLNDFVEVDVNTIQTLDDLSARASTVGHDLRTVVLAQGVVEQEEFLDDVGSIRENTAVLRRQIEDYTLEVIATPNGVVIKKFRGDPDESIDQFSLTLPAKGELNVVRPTGSYNAEAGAFITAVDTRRPPTKGPFFPHQFPQSTEHNQGFARILQEGVKDVVSSVPEPQPLPPAFQQKVK